MAKGAQDSGTPSGCTPTRTDGPWVWRPRATFWDRFAVLIRAGRAAGESGWIADHWNGPRRTTMVASSLQPAVRLNLGCGSDVREGYVNLDKFPSSPEVVQAR